MNELLDYVLEFRINDILCDEIVGELFSEFVDDLGSW